MNVRFPTAWLEESAEKYRKTQSWRSRGYIWRRGGRNTVPRGKLN